MKKILLLFGFAVLFWLFVIGNVAFSQTGQNTSRWDLYGGKWDLFTAYNDSTTSDTTWFWYIAGTDSVWYTEAFKVWPFMSVEAILADTSTGSTDSIKLIIDFLQSGETFANVAATNFVRVKTLSWQSTSSWSETDTLTAVGRYGANITDEPVHPYRWGRLRVETFLNNTQVDSIAYVRFILNGWNDK